MWPLKAGKWRRHPIFTASCPWGGSRHIALGGRTGSNALFNSKMSFLLTNKSWNCYAFKHHSIMLTLEISHQNRTQNWEIENLMNGCRLRCYSNTPRQCSITSQPACPYQGYKAGTWSDKTAWAALRNATRRSAKVWLGSTESIELLSSVNAVLSEGKCVVIARPSEDPCKAPTHGTGCSKSWHFSAVFAIPQAWN